MSRTRRLGDVAEHEAKLIEAVCEWAEAEPAANGGALPMPVTISTLVGDVLVKRIIRRPRNATDGGET